jgi:hypothetical protein
MHRPIHPRSSASRAGACSRPVGRPGGSDPESSVPADELRASSSRVVHDTHATSAQLRVQAIAVVQELVDYVIALFA